MSAVIDAVGESFGDSSECLDVFRGESGRWAPKLGLYKKKTGRSFLWRATKIGIVYAIHVIDKISGD